MKTPHDTAPITMKALLVAVQLPGVTDEDHQGSIAELGRLVETLGHPVAKVFTQKRAKIESGTVVGRGKMDEIRAFYAPSDALIVTDDPEADAIAAEEAAEAAEEAAEAEKDDGFVTDAPYVLVLDHDLTPTQTRNLHKHTGLAILDRTAVILEIFNRHAKTREARLQVEIARLAYLTPRVRDAGTGDRQRGGVGGRGVGETAHELDRRRIRDRISQLKRELEAIHKDNSARRVQRQEQALVALVGYTNAGKSSLMRELTRSDVLVADKLFATLETTVRAMQPEGPQRILVSDTVGFIKKLPHDLVASFRSTLDEALDAGLLLFMVDASDPTFRSQLAVTREVLAEIGADQDSLLVLNKWDRVPEESRRPLKAEYPEALTISALDPTDVTYVRGVITDFFERDWIEADVTIPYEKGQFAHQLRTTMRVLKEETNDDGYQFRVKAPPAKIERFRTVLAT